MGIGRGGDSPTTIACAGMASEHDEMKNSTNIANK